VIWTKEHCWHEVRGKEAVDGDNEEHISWIFEEVQKQAWKFTVEGVPRALT
jgi:hypothetical protein